MKPRSIDIFDYLFWGSMIGSIFYSIYAWDRMNAEIAADPALAGFDISPFLAVGVAFGLGLSILMWFFLSVKPSNVVRWIYTVLTVLGILMSPLQLIVLPYDEIVISLIISGLSAASVVFLFRSDSNEWFASGRGWDSSTFE